MLLFNFLSTTTTLNRSITKDKKEKIENLAKLVWACIKYNNNENQGFRLSERKYKIVKCWWFSKAFGDVYKERMSLIQC